MELVDLLRTVATAATALAILAAARAALAVRWLLDHAEPTEAAPTRR